MTIEQAIEQYDGYANVCMCHNLTVSQKEFEQLAEWLRELIERRKAPEIIRCKDCAYYDWDCVDVPYGMTKMICWCDLHYDAGNENLVVNPDDFCSFAERRTE